MGMLFLRQVLAVSAVENLYAFGLGLKLVAATELLTDSATDFDLAAAAILFRACQFHVSGSGA
jgi:hypothetical protein